MHRKIILSVAAVAMLAIPTSAIAAKVADPFAPAATKSDVKAQSGDQKYYEFASGTCDTGGPIGTVSVAKGVANYNAPTNQSWASLRTFPTNVKLGDISKLTFRSNTSSKVLYMKMKTLDVGGTQHSITYEVPSSNGQWVTNNPMTGDAVRYDDDGGMSGKTTWSSMAAGKGDQKVVQMSIVGGCTIEGGTAQVDDITVNNAVIDFR